MKPNDAVRLCPPENINESLNGSYSDSDVEAATHAYAQLTGPPNEDHHLHIDEGEEEESATSTTPTTTTPSPHTFGLSHNLSSESIKQACDYYDDELSDDDLIEVHNTPECFQKRLAAKGNQGHHHRSLRKKTARQAEAPGKGESEANPLYLCREEEEEEDEDDHGKCLILDDDDALHVLNELDAILDIHSERASHQASDDCNDDTKIEDCLLDLDNYLEEMDAASLYDVDHDGDVAGGVKEAKERGNSRTLPHHQKGDKAHLLRGHALRKTISYVIPPREEVRTPEMKLNKALSRSSDLAAFNQPARSPHTPDDDLRRSFSYDILGPAAHVTSPSPAPSTSGNRILTDENIFRNILHQNECTQTAHDERPRQVGRRAEGHPCVLSVQDIQPGGCTIVGHEQRPMSAPAHGSNSISGAPPTPDHSALFVGGSEGSSMRSYGNPSPDSILSSTDSTSTAASTHHHTNLVGSPERLTTPVAGDPENVLAGGTTTTPVTSATTTATATTTKNDWPHSFSRSLALLCCSLGLFNICRFAVLTINYGGNFLLQFAVLSVLFGIPMFWLQMCLGAKIRAGPVCMWRISPICKGIGIALILVQFIVAIYSTVAIAWLFVYIPDCIPITGTYGTVFTSRMAAASNGNLTQHIGDYFNLLVLQRLQIGKEYRFRVSDRLAFNLALIWSLVFLVLCKGFRSFGRVVFVLAGAPFLGLIAVTAKIIYITEPAKLQNIFSAMDLDDFLVNSKTWGAAAQEVFLTWVLLGASVIAVSSRSGSATPSKSALRRDAIFVVLVTMLGLGMAAMLGLCCVEILKQNTYIYVPGSFETPASSLAVHSLTTPGTSDLLSYPSKWMPHYSSFVGETYKRPRQTAAHESGYQALRFITEILPAVFTLHSATMSWVWPLGAYTVFALFGLGQLCVMWKPISSALGNSTSAVLLSCVTGLLMSVPFATEMGIAIMHYMDLIMGGAWFIPVLWAAQIFGVFLIRGRPYNGDDLVNDLKMSMSLSAFLALSWNVMLPIGLITLSVVEYKISHANQFYYWREKSYFPYWARKVAGLTQVSFLILVPIVAIIQIYRYLSNGPPDILDRIEMLYRPSPNALHRRRGGYPATGAQNGRAAGGARSGSDNRNGDDDVRSLNDDAPPKYTPPPSYTTATGARLAKLLRQSIRRSVRRILGDSSRPRPNLAIDHELPPESLPPDYTSVSTISHIAASCNDPEDRIQLQNTTNAAYANRSLSLGRKVVSPKTHRPDARPSSAAFHRHGNTQSSFTADDVVTILRSTRSNRRGGDRPDDSTREMHVIQPQRNYTFRSIENLVLNAEPVGQSSTVEETCESDGGTEDNNALHNNNNNNTSVI